MKKTPNPFDKFVGQRVRMARLMQGKSQEWLGEKLGLTFQQVQKYEAGKNRIGSSRMQQISEALEQPVSWFFDEKGGGDKKKSSDVVTQMATLPYGIDLARAYVALPHNKDRLTVMAVARAIAEAGGIVL
jgi:transcriptional regulator with XRE-family HTH domain